MRETDSKRSRAKVRCRHAKQKNREAKKRKERVMRESKWEDDKSYE